MKKRWKFRVFALVMLIGAASRMVAAQSDDPMPNRFLATSLGWITTENPPNYYPVEISDQLVLDLKNYIQYMQELGFNAIGPWGFLCNTFPFPLKVNEPSLGGTSIRVSSDHANKAQQIVQACHDHGIKFYYGFCLYFAYWQDFLDAHPQAAATGPGGTLCPTWEGTPAEGVPGSIEFMKQAIDFVVSTLTVDGLYFESFHHGRCLCMRCLERFPNTPRGTAEYHQFANGPIFQYVRTKYPKVKILFLAEGPLEVIQGTENLDILGETLKQVDFFAWCGALQSGAVMRDLAAAAPATGLMYRQEPWQSVPPSTVGRDGWFFPNLVHPLGEMIRKRSQVIDWAGIVGCGNVSSNPGENINLRFLASMMQAPGSDPQDTLRRVLRQVFQPRSDHALDELSHVFTDPELEFRQFWSTWFMHIDFMPVEFKFSPSQTVEMINSYQLALARLRAIRPELGNDQEAARLEQSIIHWIEYIKQRLKENFQYEMP